MAQRYDQDSIMKVYEYDSIRLSLPKDGDLVFYTVVKRMIDITGALLGICFFYRCLCSSRS